MKKPQFEDPIDSVKDLVEQNITIIEKSSLFLNYREFYLYQNTSEWTHVANNMIPYQNCGEETETCLGQNDSMQFYIKHHVHGNKTHAFIKMYLFNADYAVIPTKKDWYRSRELGILNPFGAQLTSNNWILNEVF